MPSPLASGWTPIYRDRLTDDGRAGCKSASCGGHITSGTPPPHTSAALRCAGLLLNQCPAGHSLWERGYGAFWLAKPKHRLGHAATATTAGFRLPTEIS